MAKSVVVQFIGDASKLKKAASESTSALDKFQKGTEKAGKKLDTFATVPIVGALVESGKAALDWRKQMESLSLGIKAVTGDTDVDTEAMEKWLSKMQDTTAFADEDLAGTFQKLINITKNYAESQKLTAFAADLARAKGVDLATVTDALVAAETGRVKGLNRLGISTKDVHGKTLSLDQIMRQNEKSVKGAAQAFADGAGKGDVMQHRLEDVGKSIGALLLPFLDKATTAITHLTDWFNHLTGGQQKMIVIISLVVAALGPLLSTGGKLISLFKGIKAASAFLDANPWVLAIVAIGAAIALLVTHWSDFKRGASEAFDFVKRIARDGANYIIDMLNGVLDALLLPVRALTHIPGVPHKGQLNELLNMAHIPHFDMGGVVLGPPGSPQLAVVHGGETVLPTRDGRGIGGDITIVLELGDRTITRTIRGGLARAGRYGARLPA